MTHPAERIDCKVCKGTGVIDPPRCPYPPDVEVMCEECYIDCDSTEHCVFCDGKGWVTENELKYAAEEEAENEK